MFVDQPFANQRTVQFVAGFVHAAVGQILEHRRQINLRVAPWPQHDAPSGGLQRGDALCRRPCLDQNLAGRRQDARGRGSVKPRVDNDANRLPRARHQPHVEPRVIFYHRSDAGQDRSCPLAPLGSGGHSSEAQDGSELALRDAAALALVGELPDRRGDGDVGAAPASERLRAARHFLGHPFGVIGAIAAWRQFQQPSPTRVKETLHAVGAMPWTTFADALEKAFRNDGHVVTRLPGPAADFQVRGAADKAANLERCKSSYRQLPGFGRLACPLHGEVTNHDGRGCRSHGRRAPKGARWELPAWRANVRV